MDRNESASGRYSPSLAQSVQNLEPARAVPAAQSVYQGENRGGTRIGNQGGDVVQGDGPAAGVVKKQLLDFDGDSRHIATQRLNQQGQGFRLERYPRALGQGFRLPAGFVHGEPLQLDGFRNCRVEPLHTFYLLFFFAIETKTRGFEKERHSGRRIFHVGRQFGGVTGRAAVGFVFFFRFLAGKRGFGAGY